MQTFKEWVDDSGYLEISISSFADNHGPNSTVMKHRTKKNGKWIYDFDLDSGEQAAAKQMPAKLQDLLKSFGL